MLYIKTNEENIVYYKHYDPIGESKHCLAKTQEEFISKGYLEDGELINLMDIPKEPEEQATKMNVLYNNPLRWEYVDRPLTQEEKLQQMVDDGIITQEQMDDLLNS